MKCISLHDKEDAEEALNKVYLLIAAYGRRVLERKGDRELTGEREPKVLSKSPHAVTTSGFIKPLKLEESLQRKSGHGLVKVRLKHLNYHG